MTRFPILLIVFNRPEHTRKVLESIMESHPLDLYIFQDGARKGNELDGEKCEKVSSVEEEGFERQLL